MCGDYLKRKLEAICVTEAVVRPGEYGERVVAVEPGGVERVPDGERHGRPLQLFWTWASPNLEFATVFVGALAVSVFGLSFWQAVLALLVGTALGSITHGVLSARGPKFGVPQMVLSRLPFGYWGNVLPAGLMSVTAGIGWFAVNSVSGAFALSTLAELPTLTSLLIIVLVQIVVAFFGHNLIHVFERYMFPFLAVVFAITAVLTLVKSHPGMTPPVTASGGFLLATGAAFGYAAGWNPYAADYTRYLPRQVSGRAVGLWAGAGIFVSCFLLELVGAASATITTSSGNPTTAFTGHLPTVVADLTLLVIALGAIAANVLNIYSGAMAFLTMGIRISARFRRALVAVVFGTIGFFVAWSGLSDAGEKYESFLLVIAYWIGPWLGVVFADQFSRRGQRIGGLLGDLYDRRHTSWAGPIAMFTGMAVSIWLFSNQTAYVGVVPEHLPAIGDITFGVGFLTAAALYLLLRPLFTDRNQIPGPVQAVHRKT